MRSPSNTPRQMPDFRCVNLRVHLDLYERLTAEARDQERNVCKEIIFRLKQSLKNDARRQRRAEAQSAEASATT